MSDHLFCYGTLMEPRILEAVTGKQLMLQKAELEGYARYLVKGEDYPGVVQESGGLTEGKLCLGITARDLKIIDRFEGDLYRRQLVRVKAAYNRTVNAWCYVVPRRASMRLSKQGWELDDYRDKFMRRHGM
ncbi:hypothetical protein A9Q99_00985 [Gammaproteobacteria bacterium 45_16_T64]|nr:hypothetical protein A9Q99_00985 [Gammaproteobacteria bacterium 45_16_T64]